MLFYVLWSHHPLYIVVWISLLLYLVQFHTFYDIIIPNIFSVISHGGLLYILLDGGVPLYLIPCPRQKGIIVPMLLLYYMLPVQCVTNCYFPLRCYVIGSYLHMGIILLDYLQYIAYLLGIYQCVCINILSPISGYVEHYM